MDYRTDDEQIARIQNNWKIYGPKIVSGILIGILIAFGIHWLTNFNQGIEQKIDEKYAEVTPFIEQWSKLEKPKKSEQQSIVDQVAKLSDELTVIDENHLLTASVLLTQAKMLFEIQQFEESYKVLQKIIDAKPITEINVMARTQMSRVLEQMDKNKEALDVLEELNDIKGYEALIAERRGDVWISNGDPIRGRAEYELAQSKSMSSDPILQMKLESAITAQASASSNSKSKSETLPSAKDSEKKVDSKS
ncbi:MAG: tetratricopeptide repeat protein [Pseudomonadota bacterium]